MFRGLIDSQSLQGNSWKQRQWFPAVIKVLQLLFFLISQKPCGFFLSLWDLIVWHNRVRCSPLSLRAVGKTSRLMEPQGKKSGGIFVSSPMMRIGKRSWIFIFQFDLIAIYTPANFIRSMMRRERTSAVPVSSPTGSSPKLCTGEKQIHTQKIYLYTGYYYRHR